MFNFYFTSWDGLAIAASGPFLDSSQQPFLRKACAPDRRIKNEQEDTSILKVLLDQAQE